MVSFFDGFGAGFALVFARGSATRISRVAHGGFNGEQWSPLTY